MQITFYSIMMATIWISIIILILFFLRRSPKYIHHFNIHNLVFIYFLCIIRFVLPLEFSFTRVINAPILYNWWIPYLYEPLFQSKLTLLHIFGYLWLFICIIKVLLFIQSYRHIQLWIKFMPKNHNKKAQSILQDLTKHPKASVICSSEIESPMQIGLFYPIILLPENSFSEKELHHIFMHELTHFHNHDVWVKLLINLMCCIFWWNPFVYLLNYELEDSLELKCDLTLTHNMTDIQKADYLHTLLSMYECQKSTYQNKKIKQRLQKRASAFYVVKKDNYILRRFQCVSTTVNKKTQFTISFAMFSCALFLLSYTIIFQGHFNAPEDNDGSIYICTDNTYLYLDKTGTYHVIHNNEHLQEISSSSALHLIEAGYELRKDKLQ